MFGECVRHDTYWSRVGRLECYGGQYGQQIELLFFCTHGGQGKIQGRRITAYCEPLCHSARTAADQDISQLVSILSFDKENGLSHAKCDPGGLLVKRLDRISTEQQYRTQRRTSSYVKVCREDSTTVRRKIPRLEAPENLPFERHDFSVSRGIMSWWWWWWLSSSSRRRSEADSQLGPLG